MCIVVSLTSQSRQTRNYFHIIIPFDFRQATLWDLHHRDCVRFFFYLSRLLCRLEKTPWEQGGSFFPDLLSPGAMAYSRENWKIYASACRKISATAMQSILQRLAIVVIHFVFILHLFCANVVYIYCILVLLLYFVRDLYTV